MGPLREHPLEILRDRLFPDVALVAFRLFDAGVLLFELGGRPPLLTALIGDDRLGEQLVAIALQVVDLGGS